MVSRSQIEAARLGFADYIGVAKYAQYNEPARRAETWTENVARTRSMFVRRFPMMEAEIVEAFDAVEALQVMSSMRALQYGGSPIEKRNERIFNCSGTPIDRPEVFGQMLYLLLCGCGVGFSVEFHHIKRMPEIGKFGGTIPEEHRIEDSVEGWGWALDALVKNSIAGRDTVFDYSAISPAGTPLSSGGYAPGPDGLRQSLLAIREVLLGAQGRKLGSWECCDMVCFSADCVLSGGNRRSSLKCIFSPDDEAMMFYRAKSNYDWSANRNRQRANVNVSAAIDRHGERSRYDFDRTFEIATSNYGCPGFFFSAGGHHLSNPCFEAAFWAKLWEAQIKALSRKVRGRWGTTGFGFCNLTEVSVADCRDENDFWRRCRLAALLGTLQAAFTSFAPIMGPVTRMIAERDALLGVGLTGMQDNPGLAFDPAAQREGVEAIRRTNAEVAERIGINPAARATVVKPSGTASIKFGCVASGIHPHHSRRYLRRVIAKPSEPAAQAFRALNPHMVEEGADGNWRLVFPIEAPESAATTVKEQPAMEFVEQVLGTYDNWIAPGTFRPDPEAPELSHNVSSTTTVKANEVPEVREAIWANRDRITAMSFVDYNFDKGQAHMPRESVDTPEEQARWEALASAYRPVDWSRVRHARHGMADKSLEPSCSGGLCEL